MTIRLSYRSLVRVTTAAALLAGSALAQVIPPPPAGFGPIPPPQQQQQPQQQPPQQQQPAPAQTPPPAAPQQEVRPVNPVPAGSMTGGLMLQNASLREVIDLLARELKIPYIMDPRVQGGVTVNTYGETKAIDNRALLDTILRINGYALIPQGDIFRIVPLAEVQRLPGLNLELNPSSIPDDDKTMLNLIFLKYATVDELSKLMNEFLGENGKLWAYPPANLMAIQDSRRNMRRLMELVALFDNEQFTNQRVKLFEVKNSRPSDLAKELEGVLKGISLNEKTSPIKLLPVDRINTLIAVAPNPGVFKDVEDWLRKLDVAVTSTAGSLDNFVYRVRFGNAATLSMAIMALYSNNPYYAMGLMSSFAASNIGMGMMNGGAYGGNVFGGAGGMGGGGMGGMMGGFGGMGGYAMGGMGGGYGMPGGYGMGMMGGYGMMPGMGGYGMPGGYGMMPGGYGASPALSANGGAAAGVAPAGFGNTGQAGANMSGQYLGSQQATAAAQAEARQPRVIPNPFDNTLLIQATRTDYEGILKLLRDIDVPPRQVLIEAKIYEVTLSGALSSGVSAYLQSRGAAPPKGFTTNLAGNFSDAGVGITTGALVGKSKELLVAMSASEIASNARVISAPAIVATDSMVASINVGTQVPTLSSSAVTNVQSGGSSVFANNVTNRDSGVTLNVLARVNPSGIVTLMIAQEVSAPIAPEAGAAIQSPSFSKRTVQTQVTVQDGDTVAIAGIINENAGNSSAGIPVLSRLPVLGAAFGSRAYKKDRTELIIFMTPRVIYDMNTVNEATDELKSRLKKLNRYIKDEDK